MTPDRGQAVDIAGLAVELKALRTEMMAKLDESDARYMRRILTATRWLEIAGRGSLFLGHVPIFWLAGTALLALAKVLENMEIGHNVMHGQYDWTGDPALQGDRYEFDTVPTADGWRRAHNRQHHGHTGIIGQDEDVGVLRISPLQPWRPLHLLQPFIALITALFSQWAVAAQNCGLGQWLRGEKSWRALRSDAMPAVRKAARKTAKDYLLFPLLAGPNFLPVLLGNLVANGIRNLWSWMVILCNHCTEKVRLFTPNEVAAQPATCRYYRMITASSNFGGPRWLHILSGHLGYHIEHHLFPRLPSSRLPEAASRVREICARYGVSYNTGSFSSQFGSILKNILRYAFP